jgi:hypothetical protein
MADSTGIAVSIGDDTTSPSCKICYYFAWSIELTSNPDLYPWGQGFIDSYDEVYTSARNGCHGCQILQSACEFVFAKLHDRVSLQIMFTKSGANLEIDVYLDSLTCIVDIFTLPGTPLLPAVLIATS